MVMLGGVAGVVSGRWEEARRWSCVAAGHGCSGEGSGEAGQGPLTRWQSALLSRQSAVRGEYKMPIDWIEVDGEPQGSQVSAYREIVQTQLCASGDRPSPYLASPIDVLAQLASGIMTRLIRSPGSPTSSLAVPCQHLRLGDEASSYCLPV